MTQVKGAQQGAPADRFSAVAPNRRLSFVVVSKDEVLYEAHGVRIGASVTQ